MTLATLPPYDTFEMLSQYDIVVVGAGPAGSTTARIAAKGGLNVLLVDKRQELGAPIQCSGAVSRHALEEAGVPIDSEYIHEHIYGFDIFNSEGASTTVDYRQLKPDIYGSASGLKPLGYVVDRRRFDRFLMTMAERAGAEVMLKTNALSYLPNPSGHCTVLLKKYDEEISVTAKVIVGADGLQSQVGKWAGLQTHIKITELASCLQYIVDGVETNGLLEIITGHDVAPGGYAWVFPKGDGYAEIGLGVIPTMTDKDARWHLNHFLSNSFFSDRFKDAKILEVQGGGVPLASPLRTQYADNMILVGDAARHVNPITGGGIHTSLSSGVIAGNFLSSIVNNNGRPSAASLQKYQMQWLRATGDKMWKLYDVKTKIFKIPDASQRDAQLYRTMADYFSPNSEFKKI